MVNPVPVDFEQQERKEQGGLIPSISYNKEISTTGVPETCPLWKQLEDFYKRNCTADDVRFPVKMPALGFVVTLVALHFFIITLGYGKGWNHIQTYAFILYFAYFVLAASAAFELWWGLKNKDKKHINMWFLLKSLEIFATINAFLYYIVYMFFHVGSSILTLFYYIFIMGLNSWICYSVFQSTKPLRDTRHFPENYISTIYRP